MANNYIPVRLEYSGGSVPTGWAEYQTGETAVMPGNLNFSGNGRRITGDFGSGPGSLANRVIFQNSAANSQTALTVMPSGTGNVAALQLFSSSDPENSSRGNINLISNVNLDISTSQSGTGVHIPITFSTSNTERMRITTAGTIQCGQTDITGMANGSQNKPGSYLVANTGAQVNQCGSDAGLYISKPSGYTSNALQYYFVNNVQVGSITTTGTVTAYNTSSDHRLKDDVQPLDAGEATDRIMAYRPVTWTWKADGSYGKGFIAHECQAVDPMTATGTKDETERVGIVVLADGTVAAESVREPEDPSVYGEGATWELTEVRAVYQGRDDSKMIPDMIAMLQKMRRELDEARTEIALLKSA